ncbi:MAG: LysE family translocator [Flavobacteriaceae bacterium]|nr:LysE family translocator [Flavobacteriaceae bacterium]RZP06192.1 MAG: LysE family translocator [Flavobacteriales bacterium]
MDIETLLTFTLASLSLTISPGPDILYVISKSIVQGKKAAILTSLGLTSGLVIHTFLIAFGLSIIISESEYILNSIKIIGVFYFIYLIIKVIQNRKTDYETKKDLHNINYFKRGLIMNLLNPKVGLFFIAFFPGFLFHSELSNQVQFLILGLIFWLQASIVFLLVSVFGSKLNSFTKSNSYYNKYLFVIEVIVYVFVIYWIVR